MAPYDDYYQYNNVTTGAFEFYDSSITLPNSYLGAPYQQAVSALTQVDDGIYSNQTVGGVNGQFGVFGFEYSSNSQDRSQGYITWVSMGKKSWTMNAAAVEPNPRTEIGQRIVSEEPMAMVSATLALLARRFPLTGS